MRSSRIAPRREITGSTVADRLARTSADVANQGGRCPFLVGHLKSVTFASATDTAVNHGLGVPAACIVVRPPYDVGAGTAFVRVAESGSAFQAKLNQNAQLGLIVDAACTLDLWFYPRSSATIDPSTKQSK